MFSARLIALPYGLGVSRLERMFVWGPRVFARDALGHGRWAYIVQTPSICPLTRRTWSAAPISLDGRLFDVLGLVPKLPAAWIAAGELIELLVAEAPRIEPGQPSSTEVDRV